MSLMDARIWHAIGLAVFCGTLLLAGTLPYADERFCADAPAPLAITASPGSAAAPAVPETAPARECTGRSFGGGVGRHAWLPLLGMLFCAGMVTIGFRRGRDGSHVAPSTILTPLERMKMEAVSSSGLQAEPNPMVRAAVESSGSSKLNEIAMLMALGGAGPAADGEDAAPADPTLRLHWMKRAEADGSVGWWVDFPEGLCPTQVRVLATPPAPVQLHVAVDGAWVETATPAPQLLVHRLGALRPGQVYLRASLATPDGSTPMIELWVEPASQAPRDAQQQPAA